MILANRGFEWFETEIKMRNHMADCVSKNSECYYRDWSILCHTYRFVLSWRKWFMALKIDAWHECQLYNFRTLGIAINMSFCFTEALHGKGATHEVVIESPNRVNHLGFIFSWLKRALTLLNYSSCLLLIIIWLWYIKQNLTVCDIPLDPYHNMPHCFIIWTSYSLKIPPYDDDT